MITIAAPDVRNLIRAGTEPFAEQPVLPLPSLPYRLGTIRRLKRPLYGFVFRFTRNVMHTFPMGVAQFCELFFQIDHLPDVVVKMRRATEKYAESIFDKIREVLRLVRLRPGFGGLGFQRGDYHLHRLIKAS